jgi:hypothetical protein
VLLVAALIPLTALVGSGAASASPVFDDAHTILSSNYTFTADGTGCTYPSTPSPSQLRPVVENGGPVSVTSSVVGSVNGPTLTDTATGSASVTGSGSVASANGLPRTIDLSVGGQMSLVTNQPTSACEIQEYATVHFDVRFTLAAPAYLSLDLTNDTNSFASLELSDGSASFIDFESYGWRSERRLRVLLPAGSYDGALEGSVGTISNSSTGGQGTASVHAVFTGPGSQTAAPSGKGHRYLTLPAAASCATGTLQPTVTSHKARAAQVRQLRFFLGDHQATLVSHPKKGAVVSVPVSPGTPSQLRAEVTLVPRPGHRPRTLNVSASYEACP